MIPRTLRRLVLLPLLLLGACSRPAAEADAPKASDAARVATAMPRRSVFRQHVEAFGTFAGDNRHAQTLTLPQPGQVIAAGNGAGADQVEGPDYSVQDQRDAYRTALRDALTDARGKADAVAQAMGGSVSGVLSVTEQDDSAPTPIYAMASKAADGAGGGTQVPPTEQGSLTVSAGVQVVFAYAG